MAAAREMALRARAASRKLQAMSTEERVAMLNRVADALVANEAAIMEANAQVGGARGAPAGRFRARKAG
jgi:delta-1-pyrroline-5-carboxylate synthetase